MRLTAFLFACSLCACSTESSDNAPADVLSEPVDASGAPPIKQDGGSVLADAAPAVDAFVEQLRDGSFPQEDGSALQDASTVEMPKLLGAWSFEEGATDGWTGSRRCEADAGCALSTGTGGRAWRDIPEYVRMTPYRVTLRAKGHGSLMGQRFALNDWKHFEIIIRAPEVSRPFDIWALPEKEALIDDVLIERVTWREQAAYSDGIVEELGHEVPGFFEPDRLRYLPKTMAALRSGAPLHILFLGDSLSADTFMGQWEALLKRKFPKANIKATLSVRGSTGVEWYAQENRLQLYVDAHKPDLVYVGGISNGVNKAAWLSAIQQMQSSMPGIEIVVGSSAIGLWLDKTSSQVVGEVAQQTQVAFLDAAKAYRQYVTALGIAIPEYGVTDPWLLGRDESVHQNNRGMEVLSRIFASFLTGSPR